MSAKVAIIMLPMPILARARSRRAPPAAISIRTALDMGARGVRSPTNFIIFSGVRMKGMISRSAGILFNALVKDCPACPSGLVKVEYRPKSIAAMRMSSGGLLMISWARRARSFPFNPS